MENTDGRTDKQTEFEIPSVCLSVRPSATLRYCVKTAKHVVEIRASCLRTKHHHKIQSGSSHIKYMLEWSIVGKSCVLLSNVN